MNVRCDSWSGAPTIPTVCPNLRRVKTGFLQESAHCSCTGKNLDYQYVNNVCKAYRFNRVNGAPYCEIRYLDCNQYKMYGVRNSQ